MRQPSVRRRPPKGTRSRYSSSLSDPPLRGRARRGAIALVEGGLELCSRVPVRYSSAMACGCPGAGEVGLGLGAGGDQPVRGVVDGFQARGRNAMVRRPRRRHFWRFLGGARRTARCSTAATSPTTARGCLRAPAARRPGGPGCAMPRRSGRPRRLRGSEAASGFSASSAVSGHQVRELLIPGEPAAFSSASSALMAMTHPQRRGAARLRYSERRSSGAAHAGDGNLRRKVVLGVGGAPRSQKNSPELRPRCARRSAPGGCWHGSRDGEQHALTRRGGCRARGAGHVRTRLLPFCLCVGISRGGRHPWRRRYRPGRRYPAGSRARC